MTESNRKVKKNNSRKIKDLRPLVPKSLIFKKFSKTVILPLRCRQKERALIPVGLHFSQDFLQVIDFIRESLASESHAPIAKSLICKEIIRTDLPAKTLLPSGGP
jgi:hypothetical protein